MDLETLWRITGVLVTALLSLGYFLTSRNHQILARLCFLVAGVFLGVTGFMWLVHTPTSLVFRLLAALGIGFFVFGIIPLLIREAWPPETVPSAPAALPPAPPAVSSAPPSIPAPNPALNPTPYAGDTDTRLNDIVASMAKEMRSFDAMYQARFEDLRSSGLQSSAPDEINRRQKQIDAIQEERQSQFRERFLPQVRALNEEILTRLHNQPLPSTASVPSLSPVASQALNAGLVYEKSISELADYLEGMSALIK